MPDTPLNPDALEAARFALTRSERAFGRDGKPADPLHVATAIVSAYLAVAQPELQANSKPNQNLEFVTTLEELDALPPESYVQGWDGFKHAKTHSGDWVLCVEHTRGSYNSESIELPARVLYRPEVKP